MQTHYGLQWRVCRSTYPAAQEKESDPQGERERELEGGVMRENNPEQAEQEYRKINPLAKDIAVIPRNQFNLNGKKVPYK